MEVRIDFTESAQDNARKRYEKAKKLEAKRLGAGKAVLDLKKSLGKMEKTVLPEEKRIVKAREKKWYEKFHWFFTSNGMLAIGGRDAHQNETINSRHFDEGDLFFHANIFGASAVVLKGGAAADMPTRGEVAQFAASYSSAWKEMLGSIDVYAMHREQVSKSTEKGSIGTGSFLLSGEREWFRNVRLELIAWVGADGTLAIAPRATYEGRGESAKAAVIAQGREKKSDAAKAIAKGLGYSDLDGIMQQLPAGTFHVAIMQG